MKFIKSIFKRKIDYKAKWKSLEKNMECRLDFLQSHSSSSSRMALIFELQMFLSLMRSLEDN